MSAQPPHVGSDEVEALLARRKQLRRRLRELKAESQRRGNGVQKIPRNRSGNGGKIIPSTPPTGIRPGTAQAAAVGLRSTDITPIRPAMVGLDVGRDAGSVTTGSQWIDRLAPSPDKTKDKHKEKHKTKKKKTKRRLPDSFDTRSRSPKKTKGSVDLFFFFFFFFFFFLGGSCT